jgi:hypothetical protein
MKQVNSRKLASFLFIVVWLDNNTFDVFAHTAAVYANCVHRSCLSQVANDKTKND